MCWPKEVSLYVYDWSTHLGKRFERICLDEFVLEDHVRKMCSMIKYIYIWNEKWDVMSCHISFVPFTVFDYSRVQLYQVLAWIIKGPQPRQKSATVGIAYCATTTSRGSQRRFQSSGSHNASVGLACGIGNGALVCSVFWFLHMYSDVHAWAAPALYETSLHRLILETIIIKCRNIRKDRTWLACEPSTFAR